MVLNVVRFPGHKKQRCSSECGDCNVCILYLCETCGGAEASLPSECPGRRMSAMEEELVQAKLLDFKSGGWVPGKRKPESFGRRPR